MDPEKVSKLRISGDERAATEARRKWKLPVLGALILGAFVLLSALYRQGMLTPAQSVQITSAGWVYPSQTVTRFNASGYVVAQRKASVASKATGRLEYLGVKEGSRVHEGDVLARLESDDLKADHAQIEAQLAAAKADLVRVETDLRTADRNLKRFQNLWERRVISQSDFENAQDQHSRSRALVDSARANIRALEASARRSAILIEYTVIRAPFDGVVLTKNADVGEIVAPFASAINAKAAVVNLADLSSLMVETDVAESFLPQVQEGQPCEIQLDALPESRFPGSAVTIVPTADRTRGTVLVKVRFDLLDPRIMPEMSARVAFLSRPLTEPEARPFLGVHHDALAERGGARGLFKIDEGRARWTSLDKPERMGDYAVLRDPIKPGDQIVMKPSPDLRDGDKIKIAE